jgi:hypothetical protein
MPCASTNNCVVSPNLCDNINERYAVANVAIDEVEKYGDPWRLSEPLPSASGEGFSTSPMKQTEG